MDFCSPPPGAARSWRAGHGMLIFSVCVQDGAVVGLRLHRSRTKPVRLVIAALAMSCALFAIRPVQGQERPADEPALAFVGGDLVPGEFSVPPGCGSLQALFRRLSRLLGPNAAVWAMPDDLHIEPREDGEFILELRFAKQVRRMQDRHCPTLMRTAAVVLAAAAGGLELDDIEDALAEGEASGDVTVQAGHGKPPPAAVPATAGETVARRSSTATGSATVADRPTTKGAESRVSPAGRADAPRRVEAKAQAEDTGGAAAAASRSRDGSTAILWGVGVGGGLVTGLGPKLAPRFELVGRVERGLWGIAWGGYYVMPTSARLQERSIAVQIVGTRLGATFRPLSMVRLSIGPELAWGLGRGTGPQVVSTPAGGWVPALFATCAINPLAFVGADLELALSTRAALARPSYLIGGGGEVFRMPPWSAGISARLWWNAL